MRTLFAVLSLFLITALLFGCIQRVEQKARIDFTRYFPLNDGNSYYYSGPMGRCAVSSIQNNLFTFTFHDSLGNVKWWQDYRLSHDTVLLDNIIDRSDSGFYVHFVPPLPFGPWSDLVGDTMLIEAVEIRNDSANSHIRIMVGYEIQGIDTISTPAGKFEGCIRVGVNYSTSENPPVSFLNGTGIYWFARDMGLVKYETINGSGILLEALIDGVEIP
ncbi:MAG: hypothetical protein AB1746_03150 [Candidatus Zixiibacteriota bacterium]